MYIRQKSVAEILVPQLCANSVIMQSISSFMSFFDSVFNAFNLLGFLAMPSDSISQNDRYGEQHSDDCDYLHPVAPSKQAKASCVAGFRVNPTAEAKAPIRKATVVFDQNFFKISLTFCIAKSPCFFECFIISHIKKSCNIQRFFVLYNYPLNTNCGRFYSLFARFFYNFQLTSNLKNGRILRFLSF